MKIPHGAWILVADGRKALLLKNAGKGLDPTLQVQEVLEAPPNPPTREQGTDRPGRSSSIDRPSAFEQTDWHKSAEEKFAVEIAQMLERASSHGNKAALVLVAPPRMLASLRKALPDTMKQAILAELDKDLTKHPLNEIAHILAAE